MSHATESINRVGTGGQRAEIQLDCSLSHFLTPEALYEAFQGLRKNASAGVDEVTYRDYEKQAKGSIQTLWEKLKSNRYRAQPLRRIYIKKEDGKKRAISIPSLEDKIVQKATVTLLNAIFEVDFLPCSYGSRPGRSPHQALDEVNRIIFREMTGYVLELDITAYYDSIVRKYLMEMIEKRISDKSILRLIGKWINVGVIDEGRLLSSETGVGQGQVISPLLANVFLHQILDRWFEDEVKPRLTRRAFEVRYVDDAVLCFEDREDAQRVLTAIGKRFAKYGLTLHPEKTRLIRFGRTALIEAERTGSQPDTFDFLGFTHYCGRNRRGGFTVKVKTMRKRLRRSLLAVDAWCKEHRHTPVKEQQDALNAKLRGHYQYYGRTMNARSLRGFYRGVERSWRRWLNRRSRRASLSWEAFYNFLTRHPLLKPYIVQTWSSSRSPA